MHLDHLNFIFIFCLHDMFENKRLKYLYYVKHHRSQEALYLVDSQQSKPMPVSLHLTHSLCLLSK